LIDKRLVVRSLQVKTVTAEEPHIFPDPETPMHVGKVRWKGTFRHVERAFCLNLLIKHIHCLLASGFTMLAVPVSPSFGGYNH
jgi:hypothetical protein